MSAERPRSAGLASALVGAGILISRFFGLFRQALMARYLGAGMAADAFNAGFKIPNMLNNLFGEGALSASFIPVYSRLLGREEHEESARVAGAVAAILGIMMAVFVLLGMLLAPVLIPLIAPGFQGEKRALTIHITRILFPGIGLAVMGAWSLGVLNSHRRFFLSYVSPVAWNLVMIGALLWYGPHAAPARMAVLLAGASVVGALVQLLVQLPTVWRLVPGLRLHLAYANAHVRQVLRNFTPVFVSRGVVQVSSYVDQLLASLLPNGAVSMIAYASTLYILPVSLFGMSISAAELPEMSRVVVEGEEGRAMLRTRLQAGLRRIAFFIVPSAAGFLLLGDVIIGALLRSGRFGHTEATYTWGILAGSCVGLLAGTMGRLYSSVYYALHDTRTPLRFALLRVALTTVLGAAFAFPLPKLLGINPLWGAAGLTASAGIAAWIEFLLLRRGINRQVGVTGVPASLMVRLWAAALVAGAAGWGAKLVAGRLHRILLGAVVVGAFAIVYGLLTLAMQVPEAKAIASRVLRKR
ncbi:MAG: murein biosynthesis integral membrane protein MurJ [Gemmatimonadaceae bacterium]